MRYQALAFWTIAGSFAIGGTSARLSLGAPPEDTPPLSGPRVETPTAKGTIVERGLGGKVVRLDVVPAEAAVRVMKLDKETRAKVDEIFAKQAAALDALVSDNLKLIVQVAEAKEAGKLDEQRALLAELMEASKPLRDRGMMGQQLAAVLSPEETRQMRAMVQEYFEAIQKELEDAPAESAAPNPAKPGDPAVKPDGKPDANPDAKRGPDRRGTAMRGEILQIAGNEVRRAYERVVTQRSKDFDQTIKTLGLSAEQESKVRKIVGDSFTASYGKSSAAEQARVFREVYQLLDDKQRAILAGMLRPAEAAPAKTPGETPAPTKR